MKNDEHISYGSSQPAISDFQLHCILQVYDDALDKAREGREFDNPGRPGSLEARAWDAGTRRGKELGPISQPAASAEPHRCEDCPPVGYPTDKTRCAPCDRRAAPVAQEPIACMVKGKLLSWKHKTIPDDCLFYAGPVAQKPVVVVAWRTVNSDGRPMTDWIDGAPAQGEQPAWRGSRFELAYAAPVAARPIDMILHCPACGAQHIDAPDGNWTNPPHRSHLCASCGHIWRPADVATNGIAAIKTKGRHDSAPVAVQPVVTDEMVTRFLGWHLPQDFAPGAGISFKPSPDPLCWPIGTDLFRDPQARAMLEYVLTEVKK